MANSDMSSYPGRSNANTSGRHPSMDPVQPKLPGKPADSIQSHKYDAPPQHTAMPRSGRQTPGGNSPPKPRGY